MRKKNAILSVVLLLGLVVSTAVNGPRLQADDREIFSGARLPYVMFVLDTSGSMKNDLPPATGNKKYTEGNPFGLSGYDYVVLTDKAAEFETYKLTSLEAGHAEKSYSFPIVKAIDFTRKVKKITYTYHYDNEAKDTDGNVIGYYVPRIQALQRVVIELLDKTRKKVQPGIAYFFKNAEGAVIRYGVTDLSVPGTNSDDKLIAMCDRVKTLSASGMTPIAESMDTVYGYFAGKINEDDGNTWAYSTSINRIPNATVPDQFWCQNTYMLLVSDGEPTSDGFDGGYDSPYTGPYDPPLEKTANDTSYADNSTTDVPNVAKWMYENRITTQGETPLEGIKTWAVGMKLGTAGKTLLQNAAKEGHGEYQDGDDFEQLIGALRKALTSMAEGNFAFASYASPKKLSDASGDTYVTYQGYFHNHPQPIWEGHLRCMKIDPQTYKYTKIWDAAEKMFTQGEAARKLKTQVPASYTGGKFTYTGYDFTTTNGSVLQNSLNAKDATEAQTIIKYIRGDATTRDVTTSTSTLFLLADIFHSDVIYVGKPQAWKERYDPPACTKTATTTCADCFLNFYGKVKNRKPAVYAGTNDGVIHAIDATATTTATGGQELGGFLPDEILPNLKNIAVNNTYTYTADGRMTATDIYSPTNKWQTVLTFGLREGGKFYYCRDITSPAATTHKWKFPDYVAAATVSSINTTGSTVTLGSATGFAQDQYLVNEKRTARARITNVSGTALIVSSTTGFSAGDKVMALPAHAKYVGETWGKPAIGRIKYKKGTAALQEVWATILTGGYGDGTNEEGKALFIVNADTGELIWHLAYAASDVTDNADCYAKNVAELNHPIPQSLRVVDLNNDTFQDTIYFGNTGGHLFKLNIANPDTSTWIPKLLYKNTGTTKQPIYLAPSVSLDKCNQIWLHFGTGDRESPQQSPTGQFIGMIDDSTKKPGDYPVTATSTLQKISWTKGTAKDTASTTSDTSKKGWYFDFLDSNEILFEPDPVVLSDTKGSYLLFNTYEPVATVDADPCGAGGNFHLYTITLPDCLSSPPWFEGERTSKRLTGPPGQIGDKTVQPTEDGDFDPEDGGEGGDPFKNPYPGGIIYLKEKTR